MQVGSTGYINANENALKNAKMHGEVEEKQLSIEQEIEKSAVEVSLSMNAQIVLYAMDSSELSKNNSIAQNNILDFLSEKEVEGELSLADLGYDGKPITELSVDEATELIGEDGFFGVNQTSQRVAQFVFSFSNDDIELLEKGRDGIVQGFEEAQELFGGELPQISYDTQARTLELIDKKIEELKNNEDIRNTDES
ncbi:MAG: hydrogenase-4 component G [Campylobacterota bacterium]|nr:hydrogenase-4 component G [Campylobacterota bacterium]